MPLIARCMGFATPKILIHQFMAAMGEVEREYMTRTQLLSMFAIAADEEADIDALIALVRPTPEAYPLGGFVTLTNVGDVYDSTPASKGLGFTAVDTNGVTKVTLRVRYNKIGTGTLSWQLWNDTDAQQIGVFDDTGAAGDNKQVDIVVDPPAPLSGGVKALRVRVKSTTPADDPLYYGSTIFVRRTARMTSEDLHEILLLGEQLIAPYDTVTAVETRLGI